MDFGADARSEVESFAPFEPVSAASAGACVPPRPYALVNQPPPLSWNDPRETSFSRRPEHSEQDSMGGSLIFWMTSNVCWHFEQRYS